VRQRLTRHWEAALPGLRAGITSIAPVFPSTFLAGTDMPVKSLSDLFIHELSDTYSAEKQMTRSLPKLARAATDEGLASAFETHLEETRSQVERIEEIAELLQIKIKRIKCDGMAGLVEEGDSLIDQIEKGPVLDAALIGAARKVEHYEIAGYNSLCTLARKLGHTEAVSLLEASLAEETATDGKLGALAEAQAMEEAIAEE
jgi:ferritin-like metal-binding protein YciE